MKIIFTINAAYVYEPVSGVVPTNGQIASGEYTRVAKGVYGRRRIVACPGGKTASGVPAKLTTELRPDFFGDRPPADRGQYAKTYFEQRVFPWNAPPGAVIHVDVEGDLELQADLRQRLGLEV